MHFDYGYHFLKRISLTSSAYTYSPTAESIAANLSADRIEMCEISPAIAITSGCDEALPILPARGTQQSGMTPCV